jgi:catechol 2,3-dioxygenase-like lactoylglutathione lyase family enzyme
MSEAASNLSAAEPSAMSPALLGAIRAVTFAVPDLAAVEAAWTGLLGYNVVRRDRVSAPTAAAWGAPALAGRPVLILGPASGEPTVVRFVEQPDVGEPPQRHAVGWSVAELTVQDSDALHTRLQGTDFTVHSPPHTVQTYDYLRAMTASGPGGEHLNLTWITRRRPDLAVATSFVGRCFIAVMGAHDLQAALDFYRETFGNSASPIRQLPGVKLAVVVLNDGSKIEIDELPGLAPRARAEGFLPPGLAMVSFECADLPRFTDRMIAPPVAGAFEPMPGRLAGVMTGAAGELLELIDAEAAGA